MQKTGKTEGYTCKKAKYKPKERIGIKQHTKERKNKDKAMCTCADYV